MRTKRKGIIATDEIQSNINQPNSYWSFEQSDKMVKQKFNWDMLILCAREYSQILLHPELTHDDVIKWEKLFALLVFCEGNPPITGRYPSQRASDAELWCFHWCAPEQRVEQFIHWSFTNTLESLSYSLPIDMKSWNLAGFAYILSPKNHTYYIYMITSVVSCGDLITHPCPDINDGLANPLLTLRHGWLITSTKIRWICLLIHIQI